MVDKKPTQLKENLFKILIGLIFALGIYDILYSFTGAYAPFGLLYPAAHVFLTVILFLALSFIWSRERWALYLFAGIVLCHLGLDLYVGAFQVVKLLLFLPLIGFIWLWKH
jgi:hypothetical protein